MVARGPKATETTRLDVSFGGRVFGAIHGYNLRDHRCSSLAEYVAAHTDTSNKVPDAFSHAEVAYLGATLLSTLPLLIDSLLG